MSTDKKYKTLTDENFEREILQSSQPSLVDFWTDWCPPCHAIAPAIEEIASEFEGSATVGKVDAAVSLAGRFSIHSVPSLLFFKDGKEVDRVTGAAPKSVLAEKLEALVRGPKPVRRPGDVAKAQRAGRASHHRSVRDPEF